MRAQTGKPRPDKLYWLAATGDASHFERRAANVLRVRVADGLFDPRSEARSPRFALQRGQKVVLRELTVEVLELTSDGRPSLCDFVFAKPLESAGYVWRVWRDGRMQEFTPPALGQQLEIAGG
jgi:hypothetical protein